MTIYVTKNYDEMSKKGAEIIAEFLKVKPAANLGLATGGTPVGMYKELIEMNKKGEISFKEVSAYNLDEYYPIEKTNDQSYDYFMKDNLFNHVDININNTHIPNGMAANCEAEGKAYDELVRATGGVDIQVLGIGGNGHIGFNEPSDIFEPITHQVTLDERTIQDNARFFNSIDEVPTQAITMGIGTIMTAKSILLLASGSGKATILREMLLGKVDPRVPASILQFHKDVKVVLDEEAAAELLSEIK
ncbi:glucosamine-6-phosphate deaminase [Niameybacter massiliensis]|uniref:Glucosamine-6-phosphate deaminase n=1 Tax=Holtiella tumoricola TaxID=3018743 RepID=A0AA42J420_9FIRM|nr:glucosamine-6-phosphate deaminase [Holtiella tumoricola]MDA3734178.1 glucosamine-6-phosphate deaminase [Holtiella tumoricola]